MVRETNLKGPVPTGAVDCWSEYAGRMAVVRAAKNSLSETPRVMTTVFSSVASTDRILENASTSGAVPLPVSAQR